MNIISVDDLPKKYRHQAEEKLMKQRKPTTMAKRSKYGNKKCEKDGIKFDSQKEMNRFISKEMIKNDYSLDEKNKSNPIYKKNK